MSDELLTHLAEAASGAGGPSIVAATSVKPGGVDPLGLRQLNFDLMDEVVPGLNNVARHVRPFVVLAWAWRRAVSLARVGGATVSVSDLEDFVERIDMIFVLSQILLDGNVDLPGRQYLAPLLRESEFVFGGAQWVERRKVRDNSTSLSAAVNYGPGLKSLGWVDFAAGAPDVLIPRPEVTAALDGFEAEIAPALTHSAFSSLAPVTVKKAEIQSWGPLWDLRKVTEAEKVVMRELLIGARAPRGRRLGIQLALRAAAQRSAETVVVRAAMSGPPSSFLPPSELVDIRDAWRRVQMRQLFRLALESLFYWTTLNLAGPPRPTASLVSQFLGHEPLEPLAGVWLESLRSQGAGPVELMERIQSACKEGQRQDLPLAIASGLALCLGEPVGESSRPQLTERLPLSRAWREAQARANAPVSEFMAHVFEAWVFAQHAYWSVGRGLADARAGDRTLLRLRVILDEGGWTLTPGAQVGNPPIPTADRLETALTLAAECDLDYAVTKAPLS